MEFQWEKGTENIGLDPHHLEYELDKFISFEGFFSQHTGRQDLYRAKVSIIFDCVYSVYTLHVDSITKSEAEEWVQKRFLTFEDDFKNTRGISYAVMMQLYDALTEWAGLRLRRREVQDAPDQSV